MIFVSRAGWGARAPKSRATFHSPQAIFLHHTTGVTLGADKSDDWVRNVQNQHMNSNGWADIGYSFLYDAYGNVFEGRGWGIQGGHTVGWNARAHAFAYLGNGDEALSSAAQDGLRWLIAEHDRKFGSKPIKGHRDANPTHCPGNWIWSHRNDFRGGSVPTPAPGPVIPPTPAPAPNNDIYSVEVMVATLPVIRRGSDGQHVRILQGLLTANGRPTAVDGDFGPGTESKLREWQGAAGLSSDGIVGPQTWRRLLCI